MVKNIITIIIKIIAILIDIIFTIICLQLLSSLVFPTRWATERRAATKQKDSKPALSDMIKVVLNMMMTMNYFGRWENYFGRLENNFGRAGGKIILAGGKIILASLVTTRQSHPVRARKEREFLKAGYGLVMIMMMVLVVVDHFLTKNISENKVTGRGCSTKRAR